MKQLDSKVHAAFGTLPGSSSSFEFFFIIINLFNFWLRWVFIATHGLSLVEATRVYSPVAVPRLVIVVGGFSCCRAWFLGGNQAL